MPNRRKIGERKNNKKKGRERNRKVKVYGVRVGVSKQHGVSVCEKKFVGKHVQTQKILTLAKGVVVQQRQLHAVIYLASPKICEPQLLGFCMSHLVASFLRRHNHLLQIVSLVAPQSTTGISLTRFLWMPGEREI